MNVKKYRLVEIVWVDAEEIGDVGWNSLKEMKAAARKPCPTMHTVGYVLHEGPYHIAVVSTIGDPDSSSLNKIPTAFIKEIRELTEDPGTRPQNPPDKNNNK